MRRPVRGTVHTVALRGPSAATCHVGCVEPARGSRREDVVPRAGDPLRPAVASVLYGRTTSIGVMPSSGGRSKPSTWA
ncbi:hypothetical protein SAMN03159343_4048 [Klenkia marina]|uniref:Uncharacterized protein n=1 Tax=Klenkia marina TaxID=1960309 RepID=A0A1G4Z493_9ACTN|nr:hypothetical protein SAMN03159343_4048 [Klenkia marina]